MGLESKLFYLSNVAAEWDEVGNEDDDCRVYQRF